MLLHFIVYTQKVNMSEKTRQTYTDAQKSEVRKLLQEGLTHKKVTEITGVGKGTVVKIAAKLKGGSANDRQSAKSSASPLDAIKAELTVIQKRKQEVENLLNGVLKQELDALNQKEKTIQDLLGLYN
jgi:transposase